MSQIPDPIIITLNIQLSNLFETTFQGQPGLEGKMGMKGDRGLDALPALDGQRGMKGDRGEPGLPCESGPRGKHTDLLNLRNASISM